MKQELKRLLLMNATSMVIFNYIGIFVNLYIWQKYNSIFDITWFNLVLFSVWGFAFMFGAKLLMKHTIRLLMRICALSGGFTFLLLSILQLDNRFLWITIIALPVGIMWGIFSAAQNLSLSLFGKGREFQNFFSYSNVIGQIISIINPIVFALIIQYIGYERSFWIMLFFVALMMMISFYIPKTSLQMQNAQQETLFKFMTWKEVFNTRELRWMIPSCLVAGLFLQFQGLFALIFTFSITQDKLYIALLNTLYTIFSIAAMFFYKKGLLRDSAWLKIGMVCISIGFLITMYPIKIILIISNILTTVGLFYFTIVWNGQQFQLIQKSHPLHQARILMWRENLLCVSRILMLLFVLPLHQVRGITFVLLIFLALICSFLVPSFQSKSFVESNH